jgi:hypothetical protein
MAPLVLPQLRTAEGGNSSACVSLCVCMSVRLCVCLCRRMCCGSTCGTIASYCRPTHRRAGPHTGGHTAVAQPTPWDTEGCPNTQSQTQTQDTQSTQGTQGTHANGSYVSLFTWGSSGSRNPSSCSSMNSSLRYDSGSPYTARTDFLPDGRGGRKRHAKQALGTRHKAYGTRHEAGEAVRQSKTE